MFSTFEAAAVAFIALIPGATYVWSVERWVGRWGAGLSDTLLRYAGVSAVMHFLLSPLTLVIWRRSELLADLPSTAFPWNRLAAGGCLPRRSFRARQPGRVRHTLRMEARFVPHCSETAESMGSLAGKG